MEKKLLGGQEESKDEDMEGRWGLSLYIVDPRSTLDITSDIHLNRIRILCIYMKGFIYRTDNNRGSKISIKSVKKGSYSYS